MEKKSLIFLVPFLLALCVSLLTMPPSNTITYDGALYIDIARNLAEDITDFTYQGIYMMYRPPLYPYTLSLPYHSIHEPYAQLTVARTVSMLFFALTAALTYLLTVEMFGDPFKGIAASLFYIFNPLAFTMATRELVHSEFTFFYTLAVYLLYTGRKRGVPYRIYLSFVSAGLAILTRYTGLSILGVFLAYLWLTDHWEWVKKREYWVGFILLGLTLAPWLYMGNLHYGGPFRPFSVASRVVTLDRPVSVSDYLHLLREDVGLLLPALAVLGFIRLKKDDKGWLLISWLFVGLMGILTVTHKETRFITFLSPAIGILAAEGVWLAGDIITAVSERTGRRIGVGRTALVVLILSLILTVPIATRAGGLKETWNEFGRYQSEVIGYAVINYDGERILVSPDMYTVAGFYYPHAAVEMLLDRKSVRDKISRGYYDTIILKEPTDHLNIEESGNYDLAMEFYDGKFKIYIKKKD
ncbi:ArnT family glycosyltransferase [Thermococcus aciditolerans]|uniref:Phospholipid carrier-dependent glycosyltransferase n=1 Tax=Thermococcus aciditolerans TaxID=2598455 RepID=A0A5C0SJF7_9EURY|nr:glycosyltransferase family 39 protein [Thermococcus aciditolerans]QEK14645.1 phospholipid carrier-dependent glycosyltransferase [Thermococcus aciditolerans]